MGNQQGIADRDAGNADPLLSDRSYQSEEALPVVAVDIDRKEYKRRPSVGEHKLGWAYALPEDVFVHFFSFLDFHDMGHVSAVNRAWHQCANEPSLWRTLDLSRHYSRVDDAVVEGLLKNNKFRELQILNLEGCSAITNRTLTAIMRSPARHTLRQLFLTDCYNLSPPRILEIARSFPLDRLELYRVTDDYSFAMELRGVRPHLNLGLFWVEWCAVSGTLLDGSAEARCAHEEGHHDRGCWGRVTGRIIYDNTFYHRGGNYPREIMYACQSHKDEDLKNDQFHQCVQCEKVFREQSMDSPLICRTCFDRENLTNKANWIALERKVIDDFGLQNILTQTLRIADRKNLPDTLRSRGVVPCNIDYKLPEVDEEEQQIDPENVPLPVFLDTNRRRVDDAVGNLRRILKRAAREDDTRALLLYDPQNAVEVMSDQGIIIDGKEGEEHMQLTQQAWSQALNIIYPFAFVMIAVLYFTTIFPFSFTEAEVTNYMQYLSEGDSGAISPLLLIGIAAGLVAFILLILFLWYVYRARCEMLFKWFLVLDILAIFVAGGYILLWMVASHLGLGIDKITLSLIAWNLGCVGAASLYLPVPPVLHRCSLIFLNTIMAIMLAETLPRWMIVFFLALVSFFDIIFEIRPGLRGASPFLIPPNVEFVHETPRILYQVGTLRLRAADLMWYGLFAMVANSTLGSIAASFTVVLSALAIVVFVAPFVGKRFRPLPVAFLLSIVLLALADNVFIPYALSLNMLRTTAA